MELEVEADSIEDLFTLRAGRILQNDIIEPKDVLTMMQIDALSSRTAMRTRLYQLGEGTDGRVIVIGAGPSGMMAAIFVLVQV